MLYKLGIATIHELTFKMLQAPIILILSLSLSALIYGIISYNNIHLNNFSLLILISAPLIPISYIISKYLCINVKPLDALAAMIFLFPIIIISLISPLPLGDDIRYIPSADITPNGIFSSIGWIVKLVEDAFLINRFGSYWAIVFILFYSYYIIFLRILERLVGLKGGMLYLASFAAIYSLNLLLPMNLQVFLSDPFSYNNYIFKETEMYYLGRSTYLDQNLLKTFSILLPFLALLSNNKKIDRGLIPLVYILGITYHLPQAFFSMFIVIFLRLRSVSYTITDYLYMIGLTTIGILLLSSLTDYSYLTFIPLKSPFYNMLNMLILISPIVVGVSLSSFANFILAHKRYNNFYIISIFILLLLLIIQKPELRVESSAYLNLYYIIFWVYYLVIFPSAFLIFINKREREKLKNDLILILPYIAVLLSIIVLSETFAYLYDKNYINTFSTYITFQNKLVKPLFLVPYVFLFILLFFRAIKGINNKQLKRGMSIFIVVVIVTNNIFFILYWGYYYRNPWANSGMTANDTNKVIEEISQMEVFGSKDLIDGYGTNGWNIRDIIALMHTGALFRSPQGEHIEVPYLTYNCIPKYFIVNQNHHYFPTLKSSSDVIHLSNIIKIDDQNIHFFKINNANYTDTKFIIGPSFSPRLDFAIKYFHDIMKLQKKFDNSYLCFSDSNDTSSEIVATVVFDDVLTIKNKEYVNLKDLIANNYNYAVIYPDKKEQFIEISTYNGVQKRLDLLDIPRGSFIISTKDLYNYIQIDNVAFNSVEKVIFTKDYNIKVLSD